MRTFTVIAVIMCLSSCDFDALDPAGSISAQELEQILQDARVCTPLDQCVIVDTYCCPRPINADMRESVEDANARLHPEDSECLADCINASELEAACVDGLCSLQPF